MLCGQRRTGGRGGTGRRCRQPVLRPATATSGRAAREASSATSRYATVSRRTGAGDGILVPVPGVVARTPAGEAALPSLWPGRHPLRFDDIHVAGHGTWLPPARSVARAVEEGLVDARTAHRAQAESVTVSDGESGPEMAVLAARAALAGAAAAGFTPQVDLVLHASVHYQGHDLWAPASYVQRHALGSSGGVCPAVEIRQLSNGGMAALELAASYLTAAPEREGALLTSGDRFSPPGFDRWNGDPGTLYADGGSALLLSRTGGFARLRSLVTFSDPELEGMHRGDDPFGTAPFAVRPTIDMEVTKKAYTSRVGVSFCISRVSAGQRSAVKRALAEADVPLDAVDWFVLPHLGRRRLEAAFFGPLGIDPDRSTWPWSRGIGHLGAGDQFAGVGHLVDSGRLRPGQRCLLLGVGAGFSWSCAVLEATG